MESNPGNSALGSRRSGLGTAVVNIDALDLEAEFLDRVHTPLAVNKSSHRCY